MFIKNLKLKNYRNYNDIEISFNSNKILFIGKNAQGKTNLYKLFKEDPEFYENYTKNISYN